MYFFLTMILSVLGAFTIQRAYKIFGYLRSYQGLPRSFILFHPFPFPGFLLPSIWWNAGADWSWKRRFYSGEQYGENIVLIPLLQGGPTIFTSNLEVTRQFNSAGSTKQHLAFRKPETFDLWADQWKKHKRVLLPALILTCIYNLVWNDSIRTYHHLISEEGWKGFQEVPINKIQNFTHKFALLVIGNCGFGFDWTRSFPSTGASKKLTLLDALHTIVDNAMYLGFIPDFIQRFLPFQKIKDTVRVAEDFTAFMKASVQEKHDQSMNYGAENAAEYRNDIFTLLVKANSEESEKNKLTDEELIGNIFLMLFAGHETTATVLAACFAYLAVHSDIQDEAYQQVISTFGSEKEPSFECFSKLGLVQAVFFEATRLFPPGYVTIRDVADDTVLNIPYLDGRDGITPIAIPKGTRYNSRYFQDPTNFMPSRWTIGDSEPEMLSSFGTGPRACIGRVCVLALFLRDWKIEPMLRHGESKERWKKRVFEAEFYVALGIRDVPLRLLRGTRR
ncbi:cytochrome P450 [Cyathus striatus]|nr:cytochrome P450 [Cyathus striatus]